MKFFRKILLIILVFTYLSGDFSINLGDYQIEARLIGIISMTFIFVIFLNKLKIDIESNYINLFVFSLFFLFITSIATFFSRIQYIAYIYWIEIIYMFLLILITYLVITVYNIDEFCNDITDIMIVISIFLSLQALITFSNSDIRGFTFIGPNVVTRIFMFGIASTFYKIESNRDINSKNILYLLLFGVAIIVIGSRGGFIGAIFTITLYASFKIQTLFTATKLKLKYTGLLLLGILFSLPFLQYIRDYFLDRFINTTFQQGGIYSSGRDVLYSLSLEIIKKNPILGNGFSSFYLYTNGEYFPHNLLLELMIDFGFIGIFLFFGLLIMTIKYLLKLRKTKYLPLALLPIYMMLVHMLSGTYYDFRYYFLWIIPILKISNHIKYN